MAGYWHDMVIEGQPVPLIAAEAYGPDEWHRLDESVVVLRDLETLQRTAWMRRGGRRPAVVAGEWWLWVLGLAQEDRVVDCACDEGLVLLG
jgi:hypothetical protein